jgi:hypothetical protein
VLRSILAVLLVCGCTPLEKRTDDAGVPDGAPSDGSHRDAGPSCAARPH